MNQEEFIKEHPGLKDKSFIITSFTPMIHPNFIRGEIEAYPKRAKRFEGEKGVIVIKLWEDKSG